MNNQIINFEILENGNLKITLNKGEKKELKELEKSCQNFGQIWTELLEPTSCNSGYALVLPEEIGALTEAPIITDCRDSDEEGNFVSHPDSKYWYYADYMVKNEFKELRKTGEIIFTKVL